MTGFNVPRSDSWTGYSTVLREDFGWVTEPDNVPIPFVQFWRLLSNVTKIRIRGDAWGYSRAGYGQEAMYLNNVTLYKAF